jgi:hypothetical protein
MILYPAFQITWEIAATEFPVFDKFAERVEKLGGLVVRRVDKQIFVVYLPTESEAVNSETMELTHSVSFEAESDEIFAVVAKAIIETKGVIIPNLLKRQFDIYMPIEGA